MSRLRWRFGHLFFVVAMLCMVAYAPLAAQAGGSYEFVSDSGCGNWLPRDVDLDQRVKGDRYRVDLESEITRAQIRSTDCAGTHFDVKIYLFGFDQDSDWNSCTVSGYPQYTFGWDVVPTGDGSSATATVYGVKLADNRLSPGDLVNIRVNCTDLWPGEYPAISVKLVGTWYSIKPDAGCEPTRFKSTETENNPGGLPVCVYTGGPTATLVDADGNDEFPFDD